jgi:hypothetical protein
VVGASILLLNGLTAFTRFTRAEDFLIRFNFSVLAAIVWCYKRIITRHSEGGKTVDSVYVDEDAHGRRSSSDALAELLTDLCIFGNTDVSLMTCQVKVGKTCTEFGQAFITYSGVWMLDREYSLRRRR